MGNVVVFNSIEEFIEEMRKDAAVLAIRSGIVRATANYKATAISPNIRNVILTANYEARDQIIRLERHCGQVWVGIESKESDDTRRRWDDGMARIVAAAAELGVDLRAGAIFTPEEAGPS